MSPLRAYAHPPAPIPPGTKQLAVIVLESGLATRNTQAALALPGAVTLAFDAAADDLAAQVATARAAGHEAMLDVPMLAGTPTGENSDASPAAIAGGRPAADAVKQLQILLARAPGTIALLSRNGDRLLADSAALWPLLQELALRGLGWVSLGTEGDLSAAVAAKVKLPAATALPALDTDPDPAAVRAAYDRALAQLETRRQAIIVVHSYPGILQLLNTWLQDLPARGIALVPASQFLKPGS